MVALLAAGAGLLALSCGPRWQEVPLAGGAIVVSMPDTAVVFSATSHTALGDYPITCANSSRIGGILSVFEVFDTTVALLDLRAASEETRRRALEALNINLCAGHDGLEPMPPDSEAAFEDPVCSGVERVWRSHDSTSRQRSCLVDGRLLVREANGPREDASGNEVVFGRHVDTFFASIRRGGVEGSS